VSRAHARRQANRGRWVVGVLGAVAVVAGLVLLSRIILFYVRVSLVGAHRAYAAAVATTEASWPKGVLALLRIPAIGVVAPVEQGTSDAVLNVAVGHLTTSVMPGAPGTSVLAAHNVSWFSGLGALHDGALIEIDTPTEQQVYRVVWHRIVQVGTPVANTSSPSVVLEACWPLDALYLTPERYLVGAVLVARTHLGVAPVLPHEATYRAVGIPAPVAAQDLSLAGNNLPMGSFAIQGDASGSWVGSSAPYSLAGAEVRWLIALLHAAANEDAAELSAVAHEPASTIAPLAHGYLGFDSLANLTEDVTGRLATSGTASVVLRTPSGPVDVTEHFAVRGRAVELVSTTIMPTG